MPFCTKCGNYYEDGSKFCENCGTSLLVSETVKEANTEEAAVNEAAETKVCEKAPEEIYEAVPVIEKENTEVKEEKEAAAPKQRPKVFSVFAKVGLILGIISISLSWIPIVGYIFAICLGIPGCALSGVGIASKKKKAVVGLVLSIISIIIGLIMYVAGMAAILGGR